MSAACWSADSLNESVCGLFLGVMFLFLWTMLKIRRAARVHRVRKTRQGSPTYPALRVGVVWYDLNVIKAISPATFLWICFGIIAFGNNEDHTIMTKTPLKSDENTVRF